jgi:hypothetical protein
MVTHVVAHITLSPGAEQVLGPGDDAAVPRAARLDRVYVHAALVAILDTGAAVAEPRPTMGCSVARASTERHRSNESPSPQAESPSPEIEYHIRTMLGLSQHKPPRLAWDRLIDCLYASCGLIVTEDDLMALPLLFDFAPTVVAQLRS